MNDGNLEFQNIYDAYQPKILRYLARFVGENDAEDLTQDTFIKVHRALENFRGESQLSTWVYRIATNTALDKIRSPSRQRTTQMFMPDQLEETNFVDEVISEEEKKPPIEKELIREEMNHCIQGFIERLPEEYRVVLVLSEWEGLKNNEIAGILGVTLSTVKIRLHRARAKLREELETHCESYWIEEMPFSVK